MVGADYKPVMFFWTSVAVFAGLKVTGKLETLLNGRWERRALPPQCALLNPLSKKEVLRSKRAVGSSKVWGQPEHGGPGV